MLILHDLEIPVGTALAGAKSYVSRAATRLQASTAIRAATCRCAGVRKRSNAASKSWRYPLISDGSGSGFDNLATS